MDTHKLFFWEKQNQVTYNIFKNIQCRWKLLKPAYEYIKTTNLPAAHKQTTIAIATNIKKYIHFAVL